eukprot:TRINITY_DN1270_c0_g3_i3.p1 TRINITY_DN1270_c0_g3~~TRINITY_DN1270_c0_g3_i3.p1  ORF type:complete len:506 (+),score=105.47 TRINITY_DN1270_c0_g3_i3:59-1519(+)
MSIADVARAVALEEELCRVLRACASGTAGLPDHLRRRLESLVGGSGHQRAPKRTARGVRSPSACHAPHRALAPAELRVSRPPDRRAPAHRAPPRLALAAVCQLLSDFASCAENVADEERAARSRARAVFRRKCALLGKRKVAPESRVSPERDRSPDTSIDRNASRVRAATAGAGMVCKAEASARRALGEAADAAAVQLVVQQEAERRALHCAFASASRVAGGAALMLEVVQKEKVREYVRGCRERVSLRALSTLQGGEIAARRRLQTDAFSVTDLLIAEVSVVAAARPAPRPRRSQGSRTSSPRTLRRPERRQPRQQQRASTPGERGVPSSKPRPSPPLRSPSPPARSPSPTPSPARHAPSPRIRPRGQKRQGRSQSRESGAQQPAQGSPTEQLRQLRRLQATGVAGLDDAIHLLERELGVSSDLSDVSAGGAVPRLHGATRWSRDPNEERLYSGLESERACSEKPAGREGSAARGRGPTSPSPPS